MSDSRPPYHRRVTRPRERAQLAPIGPAPNASNDAETLVPCPTCAPHGGRGLVPVAVAAELTSPIVSEREFSVVDSDPPGPRDSEPPQGAA